MDTFRWGQTPDYMQTRAQLAKEGMRPGRGQEPCGNLEWYSKQGHGWSTANLYDKRLAVPRREASETEKAALARGRMLQEAKRHRCRTCGVVGYDRLYPCSRHSRNHCWSCCKEDDRQYLHECRREEALWAREMIAQKAVIIDFETTGLGNPHCWAVEVGVTDLNGNTIFHSLINPGVPIPNPYIHGVTDEKVADAPSFGEILPALYMALVGRPVITYNADFDHGVLDGEWRRLAHEREWKHLQWARGFRWMCAMRAYTRWNGGGRWRKLPGGDHSALGDCRAVAWIINGMAAYAPNRSKV